MFSVGRRAWASQRILGLLNGYWVTNYGWSTVPARPNQWNDLRESCLLEGLIPRRGMNPVHKWFVCPSIPTWSRGDWVVTRQGCVSINYSEQNTWKINRPRVHEQTSGGCNAKGTKWPIQSCPAPLLPSKAPWPNDLDSHVANSGPKSAVQRPPYLRFLVEILKDNVVPLCLAGRGNQVTNHPCDAHPEQTNGAV